MGKSVRDYVVFSGRPVSPCQHWQHFLKMAMMNDKIGTNNTNGGALIFMNIYIFQESTQTH